MPGMTEAHAHLSWPSSVERFVPGMSLPPEDLLLNTARNARDAAGPWIHQRILRRGARQDPRNHAQGANRCRQDCPARRLVPASIEREPPNETPSSQGGQVGRTR